MGAVRGCVQPLTTEKLHARFRRKGRRFAAFVAFAPRPCAFEPPPSRVEPPPNTPMQDFGRQPLGDERAPAPRGRSLKPYSAKHGRPQRSLPWHEGRARLRGWCGNRYRVRGWWARTHNAVTSPHWDWSRRNGPLRHGRRSRRAPAANRRGRVAPFGVRPKADERRRRPRMLRCKGRASMHASAVRSRCVWA